MSRLPHLPGLACSFLETEGRRFHVLEAGRGTPVLFVHGNVSSATFWEEEMLALPRGLRAVAYDQQGYGESGGAEFLEARRGLAPQAEDLHRVVEALGLERFHLVGHSMGGGVVMQYLLLHSDRVLTACLAAPLSPYGWCGTRDLDGTPCHPDFAGSGGGVARPELIRRLEEGDRTTDSLSSPLSVFRSAYVRAPFRPAREDVLLESMLLTRTGPGFYPGDHEPSPHWPGCAPGTRGIANALSPRFCNLGGLAEVDGGPPVLWVRGDRDVLVSDASVADPAFAGRLGLRPGWPGPEVFPFQPMVGQTRRVLEGYGPYREVVLEECGHTPFLERPDEFRAAWHPWLEGGRPRL